MESGYSAEVLLDKPWRLDLDRVAGLLADQYPGIGTLGVSRIAGPEGQPAAALEIEGARVPFEVHRTKLAPAPLDPGLRAASSWDPEPALALHRTHLRISCTGLGSGPLWAKAYATVVTLVAGTLAGIGPVAAVRYGGSGVLLSPDGARQAARTAFTGVSPLEAWVAIHVFAPENPGLPECHGAMTRGLAPFIGREIVLAPLPVTPRQAFDKLHGAAWAALDGDAPLADGQELSDPLATEVTRVRAVREWLRPGVPVYVLVGPGSVVDAQSLSVRRAAPDRLMQVLPKLASTDGLKAAAAELPRHLRRQAGAAMSSALPMLGRGAQALGTELKHAPRHSAGALRAARKALQHGRAGLAGARSWFEARRARREED
ncbi:hypothetical protein LNKW23_35850 [Paralimibaculum aggregatum]|uniref:Uncharacterized protein n=1 Tax=Paralimibaculum aggregatum TaxID=3036245 RepID=A0ABQ6LS28_9RHOB|nr:hypothetical protein [Limibaculum sp. NKW23]GMG84370.1 hypothetical protein LNKW23_35850 [Limibaculum sp. NKW23]